MTDETKSGISRRTLAKGAAWSVPAAAVVAAAPAYAASGRPPTVTVLNACKQPGASCAPEFTKGYTFTVRLTNPTDETIYIYTPSSGTYSPAFEYDSGVIFDFDSARYYTPGTGGNPDTLGAPVGNVITLLPGQTVYIAVDGGATGNSAQTFATGTLWFAWGHTVVAGADPDHPYTPSPHDQPNPPYGEGWTGGSFNIAAFPPCDKKNNCIPTSATVTTTTTVAGTTTTTTTAGTTTTTTTAATTTTTTTAGTTTTTTTLG